MRLILLPAERFVSSVRFMNIQKYRYIRGRHPYVTVEELRRNPALLLEPRGDWAGPRFEGSTTKSLVEKFCPKEQPILECGPIWGKFLEWLQERGYCNVHALDFVDMIRWGDRGRLTFHGIDFNRETFPYPDNFFGGICAWGILEHLENPHHFIRESHRVLQEGKYLLLSMPNVLHVKSRLKFLFDGVFPRWNVKDNHTAVFPRGLFEKAFLRHFDLERVLYTHPNWNLYSHTDAWYLPKNEWFGNYVVYVLKKKRFEPFA